MHKLMTSCDLPVVNLRNITDHSPEVAELEQNLKADSHYPCSRPVKLNTGRERREH